MLIMIKTAWRNLWRNKRRTLIMISAITVGLFGVVGFIGLMNAYKENMRDNAVNTLTGHVKITALGYHDNPVPTLNFPLPPGAVQAINNAPEVVGAASRVVGMVMASNSERSDQVTLLGIEPGREAKVSILPKSIIEGRWLKGGDKRKIVVGKSLLERFKTKLGRRIVLMAYDAEGELSSQVFRIVGVFKTPTDAFDKTHIYVPLEQAQEFFVIPGRVTELVIMGESAERAQELVAEIKAHWKGDPNLEIKDWLEMLPMLAQLFKFWDAGLAIFYSIYFIAMAFGIANTFLMVVHERTREFGVMLALGVSRKMIMIMMIAESMLLAVFAGAVGAGLGIAMSFYFGKFGLDLSFAAAGQEYFGASSVMYPYLTAKDVAASLLATIVTAICVSIYPAWKAGRVQPVEAIRMQ